MSFDNAEVIISNSNVRPRRYIESFYNNCNPNALNRCIECTKIYNLLINKP